MAGKRRARDMRPLLAAEALSGGSVGRGSVASFHLFDFPDFSVAYERAFVYGIPG